MTVQEKNRMPLWLVCQPIIIDYYDPISHLQNWIASEGYLHLYIQTHAYFHSQCGTFNNLINKILTFISIFLGFVSCLLATIKPIDC